MMKKLDELPKMITWRWRKVIRKKRRLCEKYPSKYKEWMCLAKKKHGIKGRCRRECVAGALRCRLHGGKGSGRKIQTGKYSIHTRGKFKDTYEEFLNNPQAINLVDEIAMLRAFVVKILRMEGKSFSRSEKVELISKMTEIMDTIGRMADRLRKIHVSYFSMESIYLVVQQLVNIVEKTVNECPHCHKQIMEVREALAKEILDLNIPGTVEVKDGESTLVKQE